MSPDNSAVATAQPTSSPVPLPTVASTSASPTLTTTVPGISSSPTQHSPAGAKYCSLIAAVPIRFRATAVLQSATSPSPYFNLKCDTLQPLLMHCKTILAAMGLTGKLQMLFASSRLAAAMAMDAGPTSSFDWTMGSASVCRVTRQTVLAVDMSSQRTRHVQVTALLIEIQALVIMFWPQALAGHRRFYRRCRR